ncbi:DsbA family protein [Amylibacter sp. IMCC11727]|uniref:2-hydroxychromene-2-carboxylate isomerase n=1 Tax=Amylibacter sp. IMCC11727 TaxID=3039851 RepID=UPI00244DF063|nr:DsbA family protein [Amylibacter sp. IMCC11727]WGI22455.1 DsbA family protein [Amylibacter sp. IMCC11727]
MRKIEYFYSAHSAFAYIGSRKLAQICRDTGCVLDHRPIALSPVVEAVGGLSFAARTKPHVNYYFGREVERWAEYRGAEILNYRPTYHDNPLDLSNGMLIAAIEQGADVDALAQAVLQAHWRDDIDLADAAALAVVAEGIGLEAAPLLEAALSEPIQAIHAANTAEAIARNVFGSPTYFLDGDMFYGQDHLELLERAITDPFAPHTFKNP